MTGGIGCPTVFLHGRGEAVNRKDGFDRMC